MHSSLLAGFLRNVEDVNSKVVDDEVGYLSDPLEIHSYGYVGAMTSRPEPYMTLVSNVTLISAEQLTVPCALRYHCQDRSYLRSHQSDYGDLLNAFLIFQYLTCLLHMNDGAFPLVAQDSMLLRNHSSAHKIVLHVPDPRRYVLRSIVLVDTLD